MKWNSEDSSFGFLMLAVFAPVAGLCYPIAVRFRHHHLLRDAVPLKCIAMHLAGGLFVLHDWIAWHNALDTCYGLCAIQAVAATLYFCALAWKHHAYYVRHVVERPDERSVVVLSVIGCACFVLCGIARLVARLVTDRCVNLDAAFAGIGLLVTLLVAGKYHRVRCFRGASLILNVAIRMDIVCALAVVATGFLKQWDAGDFVGRAVLIILVMAFNGTFIAFMIPGFAACFGGVCRCCSHFAFCCRDTEALLLDGMSDGTPSGALDAGSGRLGQAEEAWIAESTGRTTQSMALHEHFQGQQDRLVDKLLKKFRDGRSSEDKVLRGLEQMLTSSHVPSRLLVNAKETGSGRSVLHYASAMGFMEVARRLFEYGADAVQQVPDTTGLYPLHHAVLGPPVLDGPPQFSLGRGMESPITPPGGGSNGLFSSNGPSLSSSPSQYTMVPVRGDLVQFLVRRGANVNALSQDGRSALHMCVQAAGMPLAHQHQFQLLFISSLFTTAMCHAPLPAAAPASSQDSRPGSPTSAGPPRDQHHAQQMLHQQLAVAAAQLPLVGTNDPAAFRALLDAGARQDAALPPRSAGESLAISAVGGSEQCSPVAHHCCRHGDALHKTPIVLAAELDAASLVEAMLVNALPPSTPVPSHAGSTPPQAICGALRRAGIACAECGNLPLLHVALMCNAQHTVQLLLDPPPAKQALMRLPVRYMIAAKAETPHGINAFHCAAIGGSPEAVFLVASVLERVAYCCAVERATSPPTGSCAGRSASASRPTTPAPCAPSALLGQVLAHPAFAGFRSAQEESFGRPGQTFPPPSPAPPPRKAHLLAVAKALHRNSRAVGGCSVVDDVVEAFERAPIDEARAKAECLKVRIASLLPVASARTVPSLPSLTRATSGATMSNEFTPPDLGRTTSGTLSALFGGSSTTHAVANQGVTRSTVEHVLYALHTLEQYRLQRLAPVADAAARNRRGSMAPGGLRRHSDGPGSPLPQTPQSFGASATAAPVGSPPLAALSFVRELLEAKALPHGARYSEQEPLLTPLEMAAARCNVEAVAALTAVRTALDLCEERLRGTERAEQVVRLVSPLTSPKSEDRDEPDPRPPSLDRDTLSDRTAQGSECPRMGSDESQETASPGALSRTVGPQSTFFPSTDDVSDESGNNTFVVSAPSHSDSRVASARSLDSRLPNASLPNVSIVSSANGSSVSMRTMSAPAPRRNTSERGSELPPRPVAAPPTAVVPAVHPMLRVPMVTVAMSEAREIATHTVTQAFPTAAPAFGSATSHLQLPSAHRTS